MKKYSRITEERINLTEDTYWTHDDLNPNFWTDKKLDPNVREKLLKIANDFYESTGFKAEIKDIQLTGSSANYNYHPLSDLDTHILVDFKEVNPEHPELVHQAADDKKWIWNKQHNIYIRGNEVELYVQQFDEPHTASGLYSLMNDKWVIEPEPSNPQTDPADVSSKAQAFKDEIDVLDRELTDVKDNEDAKVITNRLAELRGKIMKMRKGAFLAGKDEYSVENLAFKELRNSGYLEKVIDLSTKAYDYTFAEPLK